MIAKRLASSPRQALRAYSTRGRPPGPRSTIGRQPAPKIPRPVRRSSGQNPVQRPQPDHQPSKVEAVSDALKQNADNQSNDLVSPVHIPEDPQSVLKENHPAMGILANSSIVVQRQIEMMNVMLGFEQANRYVIMDPQGNHIGYLAEQEHGIGNAMARQAFRTHRSFTTHVFDRNEREVLRFHRPFSWISSRIRVYDPLHPDTQAYSPSTALQNTSAGSLVNQTSAQISQLALSEMRIIGEAQQQWAPLRRKYNLFLHRTFEHVQSTKEAPQLTSGDLPLSNTTALQVAESSKDSREAGFVQFAYVNEPFLSWDFSLLSSDDRLIGSVNRNFAGFARELFTDTGVYALRMDAAAVVEEPRHLISQTGHRAQKNALAEGSSSSPLGMTLDQRAVMLSTAVSIDFDYFSRSRGGIMPMPLWLPMGGEAAGAGGAVEAGAVGGAAGGAVEGAVGNAARGVGAGEGAIAGAGTMAGYEAMQRGVYGNRNAGEDASPQAGGQAQEQQMYGEGQQPSQSQQGEDVWGENSDWGGRGGSQGGDQGGTGFGGGDGGGGGGGGVDGSWFDGFF